MQIRSLLVGRKSPELVAEEFIEYFLRRSNRTNTLCLHLVLEFAEGIFIMIGFNCNIKSTYVRTGVYEWPSSLPVYVFPYNQLLFRPFANFLTHISSVVMERQKSEQETHLSGGAKAGGHDPIEYYIELLDIWHKIYKDLQQKDQKRAFEEPLARINLCLLKGLNPLRKLYHSDYKQLDVLCDYFYRSALQGLYYSECHADVVEILSNIFSKDFPLFYQYAPDSIKFFHEGFAVLNQTTTYVKMYILLKEIMENSEFTQNELQILTNYLIGDKMQEVYFTTFRYDKSKRLLTVALEFLNVLQSKLPTVDCFSKPFMESVWVLILNKNCFSLAANVYITIMRRKFDDDVILKHILEAYFTKMNSTELLPNYINTLGPNFRAIYDVDSIMKVIEAASTTGLYRSYMAHVLVYVYKNMLHDSENFGSLLEHVLLSLPLLLKKVSCQVTLGVLLHIYGGTNFTYIQRKFSYSTEIFFPFENYSFATFINSPYEYPVLFNLFVQLNRSLQITKNWHKLEECSVMIYNLFRKLEKKVDNESAYLPTIKNYNICLRKLSIILKTGYHIYDNVTDLQRRISERLIDTPQIIEFAEKTNCFHDVYAMEICTSSLKLQLNASDLSESERLLIPARAQKLMNYLLGYLKKVEDLPDMPLVRIKTIWCCFIDLHLFFHDDCTVYQMKLDTHNYSLLVEAIVLINFETHQFNCKTEEELHLHPMRVLEYQNMIFKKFIQIHACESIAISTNIVWKLCIYYKLTDHKFNSALEELMNVLVTKRFTIYKHLVPVLLFNLYMRQPPLKDQVKIQSIKAHKEFINKISSVDDIQELKVHIILTVLQIVDMAFKHKKFKSVQNRAAALKNLNILVDDIEWTDNIVLDVIINQANEIKSAGCLSVKELKSVEMFVKYFEKQRIATINAP